MHLTNDQIQVLLVEKLSGAIAPENDTLIEQLLAEDPEVRQQWLRMQHDLAQLGGAPAAIDEEEAWQTLSASLRPARPPRVLLLKRFTATAAAVIIIMVAGAMLLWKKHSPDSIAKPAAINTAPAIALVLDNGRQLLLQRPQIIHLGSWQVKADQLQMFLPTEGEGTTEWATLQIPRTLAYKLSLSDGTEVWLNAQSHLRFPLAFQDPKREVFIDGEAYFKVARDPQHPFIVHTDRTQVQVVGTQFNINTYEGTNIQTALVEGAVITRDTTGRSIAVRPGMQSVYTSTQGFRMTTFDEIEVLSWLKGVYYFHDTPLGDISKVLIRWYNVSIDFKDTALRNKTFTGKLRKSQDLQSFLDNLNLSIDMHASQRDGKVFFQ